jgi:ribosome-binding protein aMBF1 (putative translation factor)
MVKSGATQLDKHSSTKNAAPNSQCVRECGNPESENHSGRGVNLIGRAIVRLRFERGWTQEILAARMQCQGANVSRDMVVNMELGRTQITDRHISAFQKVFGVCVIELFPKAVQELDEKLASREAARPGKPRGHRKR